jgi:hypothetical protein
MADLLTHVLVSYVLLTVASWQTDRITERWVVIGMCGAAIPDLTRVSLFVPSDSISTVLGVPFSYTPISTLGGVVVVAGAITLAFERERRRVFSYLLVGGVSALVGDGLRAFADGQSTFWLYPVSWWRPPTPSLYVSSDVRVLVVMLVVSGVVFAIDWRRCSTRQ